ncbi:MAG: DUF2953 domain-containing protein [Candidatus Saccharibacteria bacterium]
MDLRIIAGLALLLFLAVLLLDIKIVFKAMYGPQNQGLYLEMILPWRLWKREFSFERPSVDTAEGPEPYLRWYQEQEGSEGETLTEGEKSFCLEDISLVWLRIHQVLRVLNNLRGNHAFRWILRAFHPLKTVEWHTVIGFEDAMKTALATGALWGLKGGAAVVIGQLSPPEKVNLGVIPSFNAEALQTEFKCIFSPKIIQVMALALMAWIESRKVARWA